MCRRGGRPSPGPDRRISSAPLRAEPSLPPPPGQWATLGVGLGSAGAFANLAAGYLDDLGTLSRVPVPHVLGTAIGTPIAVMIAGWTLAGQEPPAIGRQPMS
jgi:hypothetical protein